MNNIFKKPSVALACGLFFLSNAQHVAADMADDPILAKFMLDRIETSDEAGDSPLNWEFDGWLGKDFNKLWLKSEGERINGETEQTNELLLSHAISAFWDIRLGYRQDKTSEFDREYLSASVQGTMPYLIETDASVLFGENSQIGISATFEYELMLTQRWVLSPELEINFWRKNDPQMSVGSGLSDIELGLRLGYEIKREFMPYVGITWQKKIGNTADFARDKSEEIESATFVAGFSFWF